MLAKPHITGDLSRFCTSEQAPYKHLFLKSKRTGIAPVFLGPTAIHYSKQKSVYSKIAHAVACNTPNLAEEGKGFITDEEEALHSALREVMRHATGLRCFRHFNQNCRDKLHKLGIPKKQDQTFFLEVVFGNDDSDGILDAKDKTYQKNPRTEAKESLD